MATRFRLYSTDVDPTLTPDAYGTEEPPAEPSAVPATLIAWDHDPIRSGGIDYTPPEGRGAVIETGAGGIVIHDKGIPAGGGVLVVSGNVDSGEYLLADTIAALKVSEAVVGGQWYFTDGHSCWLVRWSRRPRGLRAWVNQFWLEHGREEYSYEFTFIVEEQVL